jgi:hypothetical protein
MSQDSAREIVVFDKNYQGSGLDFRPQPVGAEVPEVESEPAPKDSSAVESVPSSAELADVIPTPEEVETTIPQPVHPSQLQPPVPTASPTADKASGQPKAPVASKPASSEVQKTG